MLLTGNSLPEPYIISCGVSSLYIAFISTYIADLSIRIHADGTQLHRSLTTSGAVNDIIW